MRETPPPDGRMAKWILLLTLFLALVARLAAGQEDSQDNGPDAQRFAQVKRAAVEILVDDHLAGSGWFADPKGLVFTASHVIGRPGRRIEIRSPVAGRIEARVVAIDLGHDLILLRVEPREQHYPALKLAEKMPPLGADVFLVGAPLFRHAVLLRGMIAQRDTVFEYYTDKYVETIHLAATVPGGMSGGPWFNRRGEAVGLQSAVMSQNGIPVGVANAIPIDAVRNLLETQRSAATSTIGAALEETWQQGREFLDRFAPRTEGLVAKIVQKDRPAARAGLRQWDVITVVEGRPVRLTGELLRIIRGKQPGDSLKLTVLGPDGAGTRQLTVRLGKLEVGWPEAGEKE